MKVAPFSCLDLLLASFGLRETESFLDEDGGCALRLTGVAAGDDADADGESCIFFLRPPFGLHPLGGPRFF